MKEKKFLRCICCSGFTIHRFEGWWIHKHCLEEVKQRLLTIKYELPSIQRDLVIENFEKAWNNWLRGGRDFEKYRQKLLEKSFKIYQERHGKPNWQQKKARNHDIGRFMKHGNQAPWYRKNIKAKIQPNEEED